MKETENKESETKKTTIYSSKIFIGASLVSLIGLVVIVVFAQSIFSSISFSSQESSSFEVVKREEISEDPLITLVSLKPTIENSDPIRGLEEASVTIVEFGDFECSYCAAMKNILVEVLKEYPQKVRLVWKDLPLTSVHDQAYDAAIAARCAQLQGKFWEMHDLLLENYFFLSRDYYTEIAKELDLALEEFDQCVDSKKTASLVNEGIKQAQDLKIDGTPHYFINEKEISGTASFDDFKKLIELELGL